jgi:hypothetical protein
VSALDKLIEDATRLAIAAESQSVVMARLISNVERLQDRYVEKLDEIIRLRADLAAERAEVARLRRYADSIHEDRMMVLQEVHQKTADLAAERAKVERLAEVERLRAAGDALAEWLLRIVPDQDRDLNDALTEWEARRER